jgi:hypothetical protein
MFTAMGVEGTGRQMATDPHTMAAQSLKISNETDNKIEVVDSMTQGMRDTMEGVSDRPRNVNKVQVHVNEIKVGGIEGMHAIPGDSSTVPLSVSYI